MTVYMPIHIESYKMTGCEELDSRGIVNNVEYSRKRPLWLIDVLPFCFVRF